jgi:hypothetical protein
MSDENQATGNAARLFFYWIVVGIPLIWGIWTTILKLPALFN